MANLNDQIPAHAAAVTPSDTASNQGVALYIGGDGDVVLMPESGTVAVTFTAMKAGTILPFRFKRVMAATTATLLVRMW